jgi:anaerobic selenocysteine-containing dehydrogenase
LTAIKDSLHRVDVDRLRGEGRARVEYPDDGLPFPDGIFPTPSGRVELISDGLLQQGLPSLPTFVPADESPWGDPALAERFPLMLLTPKQHRRFLNSSYAHLPTHGAKEGGPFLEVHPFDAERLGLTEGEDAVVWNDRATLRLPARISDRLRPGVVAIPWGWWSDHHPDGRAVNSLTGDRLTDWGGGTAFGDALVAVRRT